MRRQQVLKRIQKNSWTAAHPGAEAFLINMEKCGDNLLIMAGFSDFDPCCAYSC
jgi:hypothetical protein